MTQYLLNGQVKLTQASGTNRMVQEGEVFYFRLLTRTLVNQSIDNANTKVIYDCIPDVYV